MAELDPDQLAALRRLRIAFGFVELLRVIDHEADEDRDGDETAEEPEQAPPPADGWRQLGGNPASNCAAAACPAPRRSC
jgi:hypothetical protein